MPGLGTRLCSRFLRMGVPWHLFTSPDVDPSKNRHVTWHGSIYLFKYFDFRHFDLPPLGRLGEQGGGVRGGCGTPRPPYW
jgi:hypothetical protein